MAPLKSAPKVGIVIAGALLLFFGLRYAASHGILPSSIGKVLTPTKASLPDVRDAELIHKIANLTEVSTAIIVTHDVRSALAISDHLWLLGRDRDNAGKVTPGAYIKETIDLIAAGLCWHPEIREMKEFAEMVVEVERKFQNL